MQHKEIKKGFRVLILEDVPPDAELVEQELRSAGIEFVSKRVDNQDAFLEALDRFSPEIILSDYSLPGFDGQSALSLVQKKAPNVPFIFVTGALGEERAVDLLKSGATDFVLKDRLIRLPLCVKRALEEVEGKRRRQEAEEELRQAHAKLEREVEARTRELQLSMEALRASEARFKLLSETAGRLLATDNPQRIINDLCRDVMAHLDCHAFFNFLVDEESGLLHLNAYAGIPEEEAKKVRWLDHGVAVRGCVARDRVPIVAENIFTTPDPRTDLVKSHGIQAYACHPLMIQERLIGTLSFGTKTRACFSSDELALMRTVSDQVATAMERMRLVQELERSRDELDQRVRKRTAELEMANEALRHLSSKLLSAQEEERKRIAGEIHDTLGASLSAAKFKVEVALQQFGKTVPAVVDPLNTVIPVIQECIEECRRIQMDLRPPMIDDLGLLVTISWFCRIFQKIYSGIRLEQEVTIEENEVPDSLKIVIYRVTQEAMNNVAKHSKADFVRLSFGKEHNRLALTIQDNGYGFTPEKALGAESTRRGLGLSSMRERVEFSRGSFAIESAEGKGTTVRASWPVAS